jgi:hypothetical protein
VRNLDAECDIGNQIENGFKIHTLSVCTDRQHNADIYTAVIYMRQGMRKAVQHLSYLQEVSVDALLHLQSSHDIVLCSVCYFCDKLYVSTVSEESKSNKNLSTLEDNDTYIKHSAEFIDEKHNQKLDGVFNGDISNSKCNLTGNYEGNSELVDKISTTLASGSSIADTQKPGSMLVLEHGKGDKPSNIVKLNMTEEEFLDELRNQALQNYGLIYLQIYNLPDRKETLVSAVWSKFKVYECYQRLGASRFSFMNELMESSGEVTPMEMIRAYEEDGVLLFAGIWTASKFKSKRPNHRNKCSPNLHSNRKRKKMKL